MSRSSAIILGIVLGVLVIGVLVGIGFVVDKTLFKNSSSSFSLQDQPTYREALFDIKSYYFKPYDEAKIVAAANAAVEKEKKKKGVTSTTELTNAGVTALVKALGDAHSEYLTPSENSRMNQDLSGSFFGVGFTLRLEKVTGPNKGLPAPGPNGQTNSTAPTAPNQQPVSPGQDARPAVVSVIKGSPSEKAGIKPGDIVMSVDGKDTLGESLDSVVLRIRGKQGTKVDIKISRNGKPMDFPMTREKIQIPDFESELVDGKYGVLKLYEFNKGVGQKVRAAVKDLQAKGAQGFILDLRNDPGGLLDEAVQVASVFIPSGTIVSFQTKGQPKIDEAAQGGAETDKPLVVLTNGGSASSSEIVMGALKDHGRAVLVGTKTYGKGSVQKVYDVGNGGAVKLTISLYYLSNGESIDGKGIVPDIVVANKNDPAAEETQQMDRAKQVLQNMIDGKPPNSLLFEELLPAA
jgi:C-terminal peptidase prc